MCQDGSPQQLRASTMTPALPAWAFAREHLGVIIPSPVPASQGERSRWSHRSALVRRTSAHFMSEQW